MISFESDYICGAHPEILKRFAETNMECLPGYGSDVYCERAAEKIKKAIGKDVQVADISVCMRLEQLSITVMRS